MVIYAGYDYYAETYQGSLTEELFNRQAVRASHYIDRITFERLKNNEETPDEVKWACCEMCDALQADEAAKVEGKNVQSVNNAGYSVTFASGVENEISGNLQKIAELYIPQKFLSMCVYDGEDCSG